MQKRHLKKVTPPAKASTTTVSRAEPSISGYQRLVLWADLPPFLQDNEYIHTHYRPQSNSIQACIASLKYLHNQTGNIYTHGIGSLFFLSFGALLYTKLSLFPVIQPTDVLVFGTFFACIIACLTMSTICHTCMNHSPAMLEQLMHFDFSGLLIAAFGAFVPGLWYTFYCMPARTKVLLIALNLCAQLFTAWFAIFSPVFRTPAWRPVRAVVFGIMAALAFIPMILGGFLFGTAEMRLQGGDLYIVAALLYISCGFFYGSRWPEKFAPGRFDVWGHSHQWFHIAGMAGMVPHILALIQACLRQKAVAHC